MAVFLLVTGLVGLYAAFRLVLDEFAKYENPKAVLSCDVNPFINCSDVMASWQGHLFGGIGGIIAARLLSATRAEKPAASPL